MITVDEVMSTELHTLCKTDSVLDARKLMIEASIRHIPILDAADKVIGLVTQRDVLAATGSGKTDTTSRQREDMEASIKLADVMTKDISVFDEHASLRKAGLYLQSHKYGCLPVESNGKLKGIITDSDFVNVAINLLEQLEENGPSEE